MTWWTRTKHTTPAHNPYFQPGLMTLLESVTDFAGSVTTAQVVGSVAALSAISFARWYAYNLKVKAHPVLHLEMTLRDVWLVLRNPHDWLLGAVAVLDISYPFHHRGERDGSRRLHESEFVMLLHPPPRIDPTFCTV